MARARARAEGTQGMVERGRDLGTSSNWSRRHNHKSNTTPLQRDTPTHLPLNKCVSQTFTITVCRRLTDRHVFTVSCCHLQIAALTTRLSQARSTLDRMKTVLPKQPTAPRRQQGQRGGATSDSSEGRPQLPPNRPNRLRITTVSSSSAMSSLCFFDAIVCVCSQAGAGSDSPKV